MPVQGHQWPKPLTVAQPEIQAGWKAFHHQAHSQPPTLTLGPPGQATPPQVHMLGVWEVTRVLGEDMQTWGECANSTQKGALPGMTFSPPHHP